MIKFKKTAFLLAACFCALNSMSLMAVLPGVSEVVTDQAPKAIGPYSQAVQAGSYLYLSGQIAIDPTTGKLSGQTIEEQTRQVLNNIEAVLAANGMTLENIVKAEVFLKDLKDFAAMNGVYAERFSKGVRPARAALQVSKLPLDAMIEISCVAYIPENNGK